MYEQRETHVICTFTILCCFIQVQQVDTLTHESQWTHNAWELSETQSECRIKLFCLQLRKYMGKDS